MSTGTTRSGSRGVHRALPMEPGGVVEDAGGKGNPRWWLETAIGWRLPLT